MQRFWRCFDRRLNNNYSSPIDQFLVALSDLPIYTCTHLFRIKYIITYQFAKTIGSRQKTSMLHWLTICNSLIFSRKHTHSSIKWCSFSWGWDCLEIHTTVGYMRITHIFQPSTTHDRTEKYSPSFINAFLLFSHSIILASIVKLSKWFQSSKWQNSKTQKANNKYNSIHLQSIAPWWNYLPLKYTINYRRTNTSLNGIQNNKSPDILANYFTLSTWTLILVMYHRNPLPQSRIPNRCPSQYDSILTKTSIVLKHNTSQKSTISIPTESKMTVVHSKKNDIQPHTNQKPSYSTAILSDLNFFSSLKKFIRTE